MTLLVSGCSKFKPRAVLNFAAVSHVERSIHGPSNCMDTNVVGAFNLLESVHAYWLLHLPDKAPMLAPKDFAGIGLQEYLTD